MFEVDFKVLTTVTCCQTTGLSLSLTVDD